ncbi:hypothetical protein LSTR_LSTR017120 [Laodelphax striatellus]|uniref:Uncharacterized protein n=1 Tax=Laodelphax striatellus TaxID=195883 RepID=A0A482X1H3_LAOST|nr:hypothetical protein LSTR_LSTR017120 [Laodelphax striatellus]
MQPSSFGSSLQQPRQSREHQLGAYLASPAAASFASPAAANYQQPQDTRLKSPIVVQGVVQEPKERRRRQGHHHQGVTGPVHTFQKTDKHAHYKWGVRHHVGHEYAGR